MYHLFIYFSFLSLPADPRYSQPELDRRKQLDEEDVDGGEEEKRNSPFQVYVAKYSYDPEQYSPNENPDAELTLNAGDYIFVYGDIDEVDFFIFPYRLFYISFQTFFSIS